MKNIASNEAITLIGVSETPWEGDAKQMGALFQDNIIFSRPNYMLRLRYIEKNLQELKNTPVSRKFFIVH